VFKVGGGYSQANMGGKEVDCPLCAGTCNIDIPEVKLKPKRKSRAKPKVVKLEEVVSDDSEKAEVSA
jgi:hypothetical protein